MENKPPTSIAHHATVELANTKLLLRPELTFHLQEYKGKPCYLIEDELNSRYFRTGLAEYNFISLLDGSTTVAQAVAQTASQLGNLAITESDAITICKWLLDNNLASTGVSRTSERLIESFEESHRKRTLQKLNPVTPKFPMFNPDRLVELINSTIGWLFSFPSFLVWLTVVAIGLYHVAANWDLMKGSASTVLSTNNWIWLGLTWIVLKCFHEIAHGVVCKRYGGTVRQAGMVLIVLIPLPFVDVSSSWRFPSKWHRIYVAAAGMYTEVFIAAFAAIIWSQLDTGVLKHQCYNIMIAGSVTTLFFNANPLMRFDGYYMLTDWLETPNLGSHGQQFLKWVGKKFYLGLDAKRPSWPEGRGAAVAIYAVLAFAWRILICAALILAAESVLFGAGIVLASLAVGMWIVWPIIKLLKYVFVSSETEEKPNAVRFCFVTSGLVAAIWGVFNYMPWYARVQAPAIVDYATKAEIRTPVGGFVKQLHVNNDQLVEQGDLIASLRNDELMADIEMLKMQIQTAELRARIYKQPPRQIAAYQVEIKTRESLIERLHERLEQKDNLQIRAQITGQIIADDLDVLLGTYLAPGHKICSIGSNQHKRVQALIAQHDFELFQNRTGSEVNVHIWGQGPGYFQAILEQVNPRARVSLPHPAFASTAGGPLPVKYRPLKTEDDTLDVDEEQPFELVDPRFVGQIALRADDGARLFPGQPGTVSFRSARGSVGEVLSEKTVSWLRRMRTQSQSAWH